MATVYSNHCCLESWLWTSKLSVSFFVTQPCKCSLTIILSFTLLKLIEFCQVETSLVHVWAVAAAHALSMVMWYHQKNCCWPVLGYVHPWNFGSKENFNTEWCLDAVHPICQSVGVSFCPTHAFCPPIIHISQSPNSKSFYWPCLLACVPSTNFTDLW